MVALREHGRAEAIFHPKPMADKLIYHPCLATTCNLDLGVGFQRLLNVLADFSPALITVDEGYYRMLNCNLECLVLRGYPGV